MPPHNTVNGSLLPDPIELPDGYDLNKLRRTGYFVVTNPTGGGLVADSYFLQVYQANIAGYRKQVQEVLAVSSGASFYRTLLNETGWTDWTERGGAIDVTADLQAFQRNSWYADVQAYAGSNGLLNNGFGSVVLQGAAAATIADGSRATILPRVVCSTAASAGAYAGLQNSGNDTAAGGPASEGTFDVSFLFSLETVVSGMRGWVVLTDNGTGTVLTTTDPSDVTAANMVGVGFDAGDTTFSLFHNDNVGSPTKVDLGANFPIAEDILYHLKMYSPYGTNEVQYTFDRVGTANIATGTISANVPVAGAPMHARMQVGTAALTSVVAISIHRAVKIRSIDP